jgi:AbiV family abortive infection protein
LDILPTPDEKIGASTSSTNGQSMKPSKSIPPEVQAIIDACVSNAEDLVKGAELLLAQNLANIAYHLGALALEEIGKSEIMGVMQAAKVREGEVSEKHLDDHVRKLFWALWGPSFGRELITGTQLETYRGLATSIHETRLQALYVGTRATRPRRETANPRPRYQKPLASSARGKPESGARCIGEKREIGKSKLESGKE